MVFLLTISIHTGHIISGLGSSILSQFPKWVRARNLYMGVTEVHAGVISSGAKELLSEHGVGFEFLEDIDVIKAKDGIVFCPFEKLVWDVADPEEAYTLIRLKLKVL